MPKEVYYRYNPDTDNFERVYPSLKSRLAEFGQGMVKTLLFSAIIFILVFYCFDSPTLENLREENKELKEQYGVLRRRLDNSFKVLDRIRERDDNFYRVMMQLDPMTRDQRLAGLDNEYRYKHISRLNDAGLVKELNQNMDLLDRQLMAQMQSFDQLRTTLGTQKDRLAHVPSILPIRMSDYTMSSGYGYRRDPIYGSMKFHEGLDFSAKTGVPVFATADGRVDVSKRQAGYGNCIDINHGYNYMSRYAHLSEMLVKEGENVKRGQLIGRVGSTGKSTAPHLHYEVRFKGEPQNPVNYYFMDLTPEAYAEMIRLADNAGHVMD